ncbi:MAG TPA: DnaJ domain-containing protein [Polyangiaceae bacterium LLY-WYZ-14_1]|nr:DnaJ domain-containing protein [Polyangiaceae bacterium LLY-WYZ-14_1]
MARSPTNDEVGARRAAIARAHALVDNPDHFAVLGVERDASPDEIKARYVELAKKWHVDAFAGSGLGPSDFVKIDAIFKRVGTAYECLSDPEARAEHQVFLDRRASGLSTNVDAILRAESMVDAGLTDLGRKRWPEAEAHLAEASRLNPDDALIRTHLAWARYRLGRGSGAAAAVAQSELQQALAQQENLPEAYRYLGTIAFEQGDLRRAIAWLNRCLEWDPKDVDAQRLVRLARTRQSKARSAGGLGGLVAKLLGKS